MKCTIPGRGIRGEFVCIHMPPSMKTSYQCLPAKHMHAVQPWSRSSPLLYPALGKAIQCLAKIGDELYIEAETDGVSNHGRVVHIDRQLH